MYAQLGDIIFEAITGFQEFSLKRETNIVQHERINSKAKLQNTGEKLDEITIKIKLHFMFTDPEVSIAELQTARQNAEILPFSWGNGTFMGNFVITSINQALLQNDNEGNILEAELDISLLESVIDDPAAQAQAEARKNGFANLENGARPRSGTFQSLSDAQKASLLLSASKAQSGKINGSANEIDKNPSKRAQKFKDTIKRLDAMASLLQKTQKLIFGNEGLKDRSENLLADIRGTLRAIARLKTVCQANDAAGVNLANQDLQNATRRMSGSSQTIAALKVTRKKV